MRNDWIGTRFFDVPFNEYVWEDVKKFVLIQEFWDLLTVKQKWGIFEKIITCNDLKAAYRWSKFAEDEIPEEFRDVLLGMGTMYILLGGEVL